MKVAELIRLCCDLVDRQLNRTHSYSESNYQNALIHYLLSNSDPKTTICREVNIVYRLANGFVFGSGRADIIIESEKDCFILELKANVDGKHIKKYFGQCARYVKHYRTNLKKTGLIVLFNCNCKPIIQML